MEVYLEQFNGRLAEWKGSLVKVEQIEESNAKEYLNKLARAGAIERVVWGWYWMPDKVKDFWDFLRKDRNFKIVAGQTAASFWNHDFVHRDAYLVKVKDPSYGKALRVFGEKHGWNIVVESLNGTQYREVNGIHVEALEDCVIECMQNWAFTDAFAMVNENRKSLLGLLEKSYWKRISKTDVRVRQALSYGCYRFNELGGNKIFPVRKTNLEDSFVSREIEEAIEKVIDLG